MADIQTCNHPRDKWISAVVGERRFFDYEIFDDSEPIYLCGICYEEVVDEEPHEDYIEQEF